MAHLPFGERVEHSQQRAARRRRVSGFATVISERRHRAISTLAKAALPAANFRIEQIIDSPPGGESRRNMGPLPLLHIVAANPISD
jgi:hypothetical protein